MRGAMFYTVLWIAGGDPNALLIDENGQTGKVYRIKKSHGD
jgi:hypothetical protein